MAFKIPARVSGIAKTTVDPLGLGYGDAIFGKGSGGPDYSSDEAAKAAAIAAGAKATDEFAAGGPAHYNWSNLGPAAQVGDTKLQDITTDPRYHEAELAALADLEGQSKNGFSARDRADRIESENAVNSANRGRIGAIQNEMRARGTNGSGMELLAQLQSAQDANTTQALRALETDAAKESRQQSATAQAGSLAGQLQGREFDQAAAKAQAQDIINKFNVSNSNQFAQYNNQGSNTTAAANSTAGYQFSKDKLGAKQSQAGLNYNVATDAENNKKLADAAAEERASGKIGAVGAIAGGVGGAILGGPAGATAGAQIGGAAGKTVGANGYRNNNGYAHGGKIPGRAEHPGDDPRNDTETVNVSPEEIVLPRTVAKSPVKAAAFVAAENDKDHGDDAIGHLLRAMASMHKKGK